MKDKGRISNIIKDFHIRSEGFHSSYWLGKLLNSFITSGHKKTVQLELKKIIIYTKIHYRTSFLDILLLVLDKIKPVFKLNFITIAGKKKEYPVYLIPVKQYKTSVFWLKKLIQKRKEKYLGIRILSQLLEVKNSRRHFLVKERDDIFRNAVVNRFNARFVYRFKG